MFPSHRILVGIFLAGGLGACARVLLTLLVDRHFHERFAFAGTLAVNLLGCLAIGSVAGLAAPAWVRMVFVGGFLGGFTTYSSFGLLSWDLLEHGRYGTLAAQIAIHLFGGIAGVYAGFALVRAFGLAK
jgi:CrcB protein